MNSRTDSQLLRDYAERQSEAAFAELVRRHVDLVYSAALRMVCDSHLAEDVTQGAFVALARGAHQLTERAVLSGWLHRTAQNIAAQTVRTDVRRRAREQETAAMNELLANESDAAWEHIAPHLDAALGELSEADRDALMLRYFERKSAREMAQTLGISDEAAQKRVNRAIDRVRECFAKRGVTVGASGLVVVISANAVHAAPVGLAATLSTASADLAHSVISSATVTSTSTLMKGTLTFMTTTKQKLALVLAVALLTILGGTVLLFLNRSRPAPHLAVMPVERLKTGFEIRWVAVEGDINSPADVLPGAGTNMSSREFRVQKEVVLDGNDVMSAGFGNDQAGIRELVLDLTANGARKLAQSTAENIGRQLAIVWNDRVINTPRIRSAMHGPRVNLTGTFSDAEAQMLLDALNHQ